MAKKYVGLDVSLEQTSICILDADGRILEQGTAATDAKAVKTFLTGKGRFRHVGIEASATGMWLAQALGRLGLPVVVVESRHAHNLLKTRANKTDKNDAIGIAELMRMGMFRPVHQKSAEALRIRGLLTARRLLLGKAIDLELAITGILRGMGLKPGRPIKSGFEQRVMAVLKGKPEVTTVIRPLLEARNALREQYEQLQQTAEYMAKNDVICRRLMTAPGVGPIVALSYKQVIDDPTRFQSSRTVGAHLGMTPRVIESGESKRRGRITHFGDRWLRQALVTAAMASLRSNTRSTSLSVWGKKIAERRGRLIAAVAVARRLSVILHHMWVEERDFQQFS